MRVLIGVILDLMLPKNFPYSPMIYRYLKKYHEDPTSRVFAPLAEAYRKAGLIEEALVVARTGKKLHPDFLGGRVVLARVLFDQKLYIEVIEELESVIQNAPDNLVAQRLLAESHLMLGHVPNALQSFKMLLYFCPQDSELNQIVQELEDQAYQKGLLPLRTDVSPAHGAFSVVPAQGVIQNSPEVKQAHKINKVERLQQLLQKIERYRILIQFSDSER